MSTCYSDGSVEGPEFGFWWEMKDVFERMQELFSSRLLSRYKREIAGKVEDLGLFVELNTTYHNRRLYQGVSVMWLITTPFQCIIHNVIMANSFLRHIAIPTVSRKDVYKTTQSSDLAEAYFPFEMP